MISNNQSTINNSITPSPKSFNNSAFSTVTYPSTNYFSIIKFQEVQIVLAALYPLSASSWRYLYSTQTSRVNEENSIQLYYKLHFPFLFLILMYNNDTETARITYSALNFVFRLEKLDRRNPVRKFAIQSRSRPLRFLAFSNHEKGDPKEEISKWLTVCSTFSISGWRVVGSASITKGSTSKKRPSPHLHKVPTRSNKASPGTLQTALVHTSYVT
jgi:hypothetical protein